jgi:hypothetical protein
MPIDAVIQTQKIGKPPKNGSKTKRLQAEAASLQKADHAAENLVLRSVRVRQGSLRR